MRFAPWTSNDTIVVVIVAVVIGLLAQSFSTSPFSYSRHYRRWRGGRWARVSHGWIRVGDAAYGRVDEDWRADSPEAR